MAGLLAATKLIKTRLTAQRIVILGAGSSAIGISDQIIAAMGNEGVSEAQARTSLCLVDSQGLVHDARPHLDQFKRKYAQPLERTREWEINDRSRISFDEVVKSLRPTVLIGTSAQPGAFTEQVIREMAKHSERPLIFPLSNPTSRSEATPADLIAWTDGRALVATGSPFAPIVHNGRILEIGQCNNSFIFPGVGLGIIASGARRVTDRMFVAAARVLSEFSPALRQPHAALYPPLEEVREISRRVALSVGVEAQKSGSAEPTSFNVLEQRVEEKMWKPHYVRLRRSKTTPAL